MKKTDKDVLFQKLGNAWYAFTHDEKGNIVFTALPEDLSDKKIELLEVVESEKKKRPADKAA